MSNRDLPWERGKEYDSEKCIDHRLHDPNQESKIRPMRTTRHFTKRHSTLSTSPALVSLIALLLAVSNACAQSSPRSPSSAGGTEMKGLAHHEIKASDLPAPKIENDVDNGPRVIARPEGASLTMPPGFEISVFAEGGFTRPRWIALAPNGDVFLADSMWGKIIVLRDTNNDGVADQRFTFAEGLNEPFGIAFWHDYVYIATTD